MSIAAQTFNGALLGVPVSTCLIALTTAIRWRATKYAAPAERPTEEDAVDRALDAVKAEDEKKKLPWWLMPLYWLAGIVIGIGFTYLPDWSSVLLWVWSSGFPIAWCVSATFNDITGVKLFGIARRIDDRREIVHNGDRVSRWKQALPGLSAATCIIGATLLGLDTPAVQFAICTLLATVIPYRLGLLTFHIKGKPASIKWFIFGFTALMTFATILVGALVTIAMFVSSKIGGTRKTPEPPTVNSPIKEFGSRLIPLMSVAQLFFIMGFYGHIFTTLYKVDWILASKRQGVHLDNDNREERGLFPDYPAQHLEPKDEKDKEMLAQMGPVITLPSLMSLVRSGEIRQFFVKPVYTLTAVLAYQVTLLLCSCVLKSSRMVVLLTGAEPGKVTLPQMDGAIYIVALAGIMLAPLGIAFALGSVSFFRGEASMVFNYRSEPFPYQPLDSRLSGFGDEKESFEEDRPMDDARKI